MGKIYGGIDNLANEIKKIYTNINDVNVEIKKVYAGVNNNAKLIWESYVPILPSEYQQVEYLQSSGTQYIDTGVKVKNTTKISVDYQVIQYLSGMQGVMGMQGSSASNRFYVAISSENKANYALGNGYGAYTQDDSRHTVIIDAPNKKILINGNYLSPATGSYSYFNNNNVNIQIFGIYSAYSSKQLNSACKVYSAKIYESETLLYNFYPCYRKSDNVAGLYNIINDIFYTNAGTDTFIIGPNWEGEL